MHDKISHKLKWTQLVHRNNKNSLSLKSKKYHYTTNIKSKDLSFGIHYKYFEIEWSGHLNTVEKLTRQLYEKSSLERMIEKSNIIGLNLLITIVFA